MCEEFGGLDVCDELGGKIAVCGEMEENRQEPHIKEQRKTKRTAAARVATVDDKEEASSTASLRRPSAPGSSTCSPSNAAKHRDSTSPLLGRSDDPSFQPRLSPARAILSYMQRSPTELAAILVSGKGDSGGEDRAYCEIQLTHARRESGLAGDGHVNNMEPTSEQEPQEAADVAHEDQGGEVETTSTESSASSVDGSCAASMSPSPAAEEAGARPHFSCCLCPEDEGAPVEALFRCPCRCPDTFVHRSCLEQLLYIDPEGAT
ncbi:hypothetical protein HPB50_013490 [Hyalomma asiaticum]|uniref:Uncharacterized protein n=1 Tax=Hyalomma asiaticum TaxID=266040 RepID=A0ACB7RW53_HYAAI|nr:hypothetical protein HPB50_013490 [Hyalomma asiaticum]